MKLKKIILSILGLIIIIGLFIAVTAKSVKSNRHSSQQQIVATNFACYDFIRAIIGDGDTFKLTYLLGPGKDAHSYEPTAKDLILIQNAALFVYIGGEMENWANRITQTLGTSDKNNAKLICIADCVGTIDEKEVDGAEDEHHHDGGEHHHDEDEHHHDEDEHHHDEDEHHHDGDEHHHDEDEHHHDGENDKTKHTHVHAKGAFDEHIWTSPANAVKMVNALCSAICELDPANASFYRQNAQDYINKINEVDSQIRTVVNNKLRSRLVFADKMPMQYFIDYYGLDVTAAFSGCSTETEPSAKTIAYLQDKVRSEKIPVLLYIELNDGTVAKTIAAEVGGGCQALQIQALHNVSLQDFNNGETWVSLMTRNIDVLRKALQ